MGLACRETREGALGWKERLVLGVPHKDQKPVPDNYVDWEFGKHRLGHSLLVISPTVEPLLGQL